MNKIFFIVLVSLMLNQCKTSNINNENCDLLNIAIKSPKFQSYFRVCDSKKMEFNVYNNTTSYKNCLFTIKDDKCGKTIYFKQKEFELDFNNRKTIDKGIVLYQVDKSRTLKKLYFLNVYNNAYLVLIFDKNNNYISFKNGAF